MAILVTGGAGYTGAHVCVDLLKQGYEVIIVDNFLRSNPEALTQIRKESGKDFKLYAMDLGNREIVERVFKENEIEGVIHFAGVKSTGDCKNKPITYYQSNLVSTLILCDIMAEYNVKKIVFSSSEGFYGDNGAGTSVYGSAKLMIERILLELHKADPTWGIKIIRYLNQENDVYTKEDVRVQDMSQVYIDALQEIEEGSFETYNVRIADKSVRVQSIEPYGDYSF